jgi:hypothetical protein
VYLNPLLFRSGLLSAISRPKTKVEIKMLNQAVKRNKERFPEEFCFQLNNIEFQDWKSQIVTSKSIKMGLRRPPYAFTEQALIIPNPNK